MAIETESDQEQEEQCASHLSLPRAIPLSQHQTSAHVQLNWSKVVQAALPVMLGYITIGLPCGIMESTIGMTPLMSLLVSALFYSGAGQFMVCNLWFAGAHALNIAVSVVCVSARQMLYSAAMVPYLQKAPRLWLLSCAATMTDESFGVSVDRFQEDVSWNYKESTFLNCLCLSSWALSDALGCWFGAGLTIPMTITAFAMTSIFICMLSLQSWNKVTIWVAVIAAVALCAFKLLLPQSPTIVLAVIAAVGFGVWMDDSQEESEC